jgi:uncharacterized protein YkwD
MGLNNSSGIRAILRAAGCIFVILLHSGFGQARETYVQYVQRLVEHPQEGMVFRPDLEQYIGQLLLSYRKGGSALVVAAGLQRAARAHAMDMAINGFVGHKSSNGYGFDSRMRALKGGALFLPVMGENAARERSKGPANQAKAKRLFGQWVNSPAHRKAMINRSFSSASIGVVQKGDHLYAVTIFSGPDVKTNVRRDVAVPDGVY